MNLSTKQVRLGMAGSTLAIGAVGAVPQYELGIEWHEGAVGAGLVLEAHPELDNFTSRSAWAFVSSSIQSTSTSSADALADFVGVHPDLVRRHFVFNKTAADLATSALRSCLERYLRLRDGWDGPESKAPSRRSIEIIEAMLNRLPTCLPIPTAMLSRSGEVGLYWDSLTTFADIVLEDDRVFSFFVRNKGSGVEAFADYLLADEISSEKLDELVASVALRKG